MKIWIVSSLDEETIQGKKLYEEIRYVKNCWTASSEQLWIRKKYVLLSGSWEEQLLLTMKSAALRPKSQLSQQRRRTLSLRLHHSTMVGITKVCPKIISSLLLLRYWFMIQFTDEDHILGRTYKDQPIKMSDIRSSSAYRGFLPYATFET